MVIIKKTQQGIADNVAQWMKEKLILAERGRDSWEIPWPESSCPWMATRGNWEEVPPFDINNYRNTPIHCPTQELADEVALILGSSINGDWCIYRREFCILPNVFVQYSSEEYYRTSKYHTYNPSIEATYFIQHYKLTKQMEEMNADTQPSLVGNNGDICNPQSLYYSVTSNPTKLKKFIIEGKPSLIDAIWEDLKEMGYTLSPMSINTNRRVIGVNAGILSLKDLHAATELYAIDTISAFSEQSEPRFKLPAQYVEALAFAEGQMAAAKKLFEKPKELKLLLGLPKREVVIKADGSGLVYVTGDAPYPLSRIKLLIGSIHAFAKGDTFDTNNGSVRALKLEKVWIGCEEGSEFTVGELETVVTAYDNLQKGL